ncbi:MAG: hypothetical protein IPM74_07900 [Crocinitomicaceae bacterium]|nr:hypothetical protein [Crocinitomicaceae bacterium]MBK8925822.1 hypothetical protein [Crocinitomicaceae bacterium]
MGQLIEVNQGEVIVKFTTPVSGKVSFATLGIKKEDLVLKGGFLRIVFDFEGIGEHHYFQVPTVNVSYSAQLADTHWQCDFNGVTILDKTDHYGNSTVILLNRDKLAQLEHHHQNKLVLHAEFPESINIIPEESYVNFFK